MARIKSKVSKRFKVRLDLDEEEMTWLLLLSSASASFPDHLRKINGWPNFNPVPAQVGILLHTIHQECEKVLLNRKQEVQECTKETNKPSAKPRANIARKK